MRRLQLIFSIIFMLFLTSCGGRVRIEGIEIVFPERATQAPATATLPPSATLSPSPTASPTITATAVVGLNAVTTANVNFRTGPATTYSIITTIPNGTSVRLIGRYLPLNDWALVRLSDGRLGWMYTQNLRIDGNITTLPPASPSPTPTPTATATIDPTPTREVGSRISYNINGEAVPNRGYLMEIMTNPCKTVALVMNNLGLAIEIKQACPDTIVVSRNYSSLEGDEWLQPASTFINRWKAEGHPEIIRHSTNEPSFGRGRRLEEFVNKECELMRAAREAGFTLAMGNFSVGIYEPEDISTGLFDSYIRCINRYGHYLALHEYAVVALPFGVGQWQTSYLLDRNRVQPASWPLAASLPVRMWDGQLPPYWYLLRGAWWLLRADAIGERRPLIILTEFGWDNLPNVKPEIEWLRQNYGLPQYFNDMRGINTYPRVWSWYWPQWSFARAACEQLLWADSIYPPEFIGFALFTWSSDKTWAQTDFSSFVNPSLRELHTCLRN